MAGTPFLLLTAHLVVFGWSSRSAIQVVIGRGWLTKNEMVIPLISFDELRMSGTFASALRPLTTPLVVSLPALSEVEGSNHTSGE